MSKTLYIARHAKSSWDDPSQSDFERPLNKRGLRDAPMMAKLLRSKGVLPQIIVSSPALRAKTTAEIYHKAIGGELIYDERIYEASAMALKYLIDEYLIRCNSLMIVGHNPGLTSLNDRLSDMSIYNLPTAAVVGIEFEDNNLEQGRQILYEYPKKYR